MILNRRPLERLAVILVTTVVVGTAVDRVLAADVLWLGTSGNNWNTPASWTGGFVPEAQFEEVGVINNANTVVITGPSPDAAGLVLGQALGDSGTLQVMSGGSINFVVSTGAPAGVANVALDGAGTLDVRGGGSVSTALLDVNAMGNVIVGSGTGAASLTSTGGMFLGGTTTIHGTGHTFSAATNVTFEGTGNYVVDIASPATVTTLNAGGAVTLGGRIKPMLTGASPTPGNKWNIVDAASVGGAFATLDLTGVPAAPDGVAYQINTVPGGTHGRLVQLQYNALLRLSVNSDTHAMSFRSPSGTAVNIVGYTVGTTNATFNPANGQWNSLHDQNLAGAWEEAAPTATSLSELSGNNTQSLSVGSTTVSLGTPYTFAPASFGTGPNVTFEYATSTGEIRQGLVEYIGSTGVNNLQLTIDPANGNAKLQNSSTFSVNLLGYSILSASGSLKPANGNWSSLVDQGATGTTGWQEAAPTANNLSELAGPLGSALPLGPGQSYSLGGLFNNLTGVRDLSLEFLLDGEASPRLGVVTYAAISNPGGVKGDYNGNNVVDAADYTVWRDHLGAATLTNRGDGITGPVGTADYNFWKSRFGATSGSGAGGVASVSSVPEPSSILCFVLAGVSIVAGGRRRGIAC
jgi:hypothetical protein